MGVKTMSWLGKRVTYSSLGSKEQESYNTSKLISAMAEYGYLECMKINGDKWGADLLFYRSSDSDVKKVQLKGRATFSKHYIGKDLYVAFPGAFSGEWYLYNHDELVQQCIFKSTWTQSSSWCKSGGYSWNEPPKWLKAELQRWKI